MALLSKQAAGLPALNPINMVACAGGGDTIAAEAGTYLLVRNSDASAKTVTLVDPRTSYGQPNPDPATVVAASALALIKVPPEFADPTTGMVSITYSAVTSLTIAAIRG